MCGQKAALLVHSTEPRLWTTLGLALTYCGRAAEALTFFDEGIRLGPTLVGALYNRGMALLDLGRMDEAEADFRAACKKSRDPAERATIEFSLATLVLGRGELAEGWSLYERRLSPDCPRSVIFQGAGRRLAKDDALAGRSVLVLAEQGVGDEILFANAAAAAIAGVPDPADLVGRSVSSLVEPRDVATIRDLVDRLTSDEDTQDVSIDLQVRNRGTFPMHVSARRVTWASRRATQLVAHDRRRRDRSAGRRGH